jgi:hypothetical protein
MVCAEDRRRWGRTWPEIAGYICVCLPSVLILLKDLFYIINAVERLNHINETIPVTLETNYGAHHLVAATKN